MGVNISDVAAMCGVPRFAVVAVALPRRNAEAVGRGLDAGLRLMAGRFGVHLVGGDTNAWDGPLVVSVTLMGDPHPLGSPSRAGARVGDVVIVTGPLGGSFFRGRHLRPEPRVREAQAIRPVMDPTAMIDLSDGLSSDLGHILDESGGLGAVLDEAAIPIHPDAVAHAAEDGVPPLRHALNDGEDFELCFTVRPEIAARIVPGVALHRIGRIVAEPGIRLRAADGRLTPLARQGFDHFQSPTPQAADDPSR
jgi:thiamine-monophosphate kinase